MNLPSFQTVWGMMETLVLKIQLYDHFMLHSGLFLSISSLSQKTAIIL